ncbi:MAG: ATP-binding cassette domain-containing protein [Candidatus Sumerlaeaceae bacterium]|nr:ATP-binding cassette domain-containing protein [Candidatus Sumerlaeaceae bacterium]
MTRHDHDLLIDVRDLTKVFRTQRVQEGMWGAVKSLFWRETRETLAVDRMTFSLQRGEIVGYIGANGAGKSTTIKMLTGILVPTSGEVTVAGFVPYRQRRQYVRNIGVVFGQRTQLWWDLAVLESFRLLGKIYEVPEASFRQRMGELSDLLGLDEFLHTPVRKLSLGQRMRCDLAASLLHRPMILFLDEPTIGLDVLGKSQVRDFLRALNEKEKVTILLTTHDLAEIEKLCERIIIIDHGRKVFDGALDRLIETTIPRKRIVVDFERDPQPEDFAELAARGVVFRRLQEYRGEFIFDRRAVAAGELINRISARHTIRDLTIEEPGIEDVVKDIYAQRGLASAGGAFSLENGRPLEDEQRRLPNAT